MKPGTPLSTTELSLLRVLNSVDLVNGNFWNLRDVVVLASSLQSFRGGEDGRSTLDRPGEQDLGWGQRGLLGDG